MPVNMTIPPNIEYTYDDNDNDDDDNDTISYLICISHPFINKMHVIIIITIMNTSL